MKSHLLLFTFFLVFWNTQFCFGSSKVLRLSQSIDKVDVWPYVGLYVDSTAEAGIEEVIHHSFDFNKRQTPNFAPTHHDFWLTFDVVNTDTVDTDWIFEFGHATLGDVQVFVFTDGEQVMQIATGLYHLENREGQLRYRNPLFSFDMEQHKRYTLYARVRTNSVMTIPLTVFAEKAFYQHDIRERNILMLFIGILFAVIIFNAILFVVSRDIMYLFLSVSLLFINAYFLIGTGFTSEIKLGISPQWIERMRMMGYLASSLFAFLFATVFLELRKYGRILHVIFIGSAIGFFLFLVVTAMPQVSFLALNKVTGIMYLYIVLVMIWGSIVAIVKGNKLAWYYLISILVFIIGGVTTHSVYTGTSEVNFFVQNNTLICFTIYSLVLTVGLTEKVAYKKREKQRVTNLMEVNEQLREEIEKRSLMELELSLHKNHLEELVSNETIIRLENEKNYSYVVENLYDWVWQVDENGIFVFNSPGVGNVLGYTQKDLEGKHYNFVFSMRDTKKMLSLSLLNDEQYSTISDHEFSFLSKENKTVILETRCILKKDKDGNADGFYGISRDISEKKMLERKILKAIIETEEKERNRFAIELHDGLGATLSGINMYLNTIISEDLEEKVKNDLIQKSNILIKQVAADVREIARDIRPFVLNEFGLAASIDSLCDRLTTTGDTVIDLNSNKLSRALDQDTELVLFRIISELLNNTINHAKASHIKIDLFNVENKLFLIYHDDGIGFDYSEYLKNEQKGMGVQNIINRLTSVNGNYTIETKPGEGFRVYIEMALE